MTGIISNIITSDILVTCIFVCLSLSGAGLILDKNQLRPDNIRRMVLDLCHNNRYYANVVHVSELFLFTIRCPASYRKAAQRVGRILAAADGAATAANIVEFAMHPGIGHLRSLDVKVLLIC